MKEKTTLAELVEFVEGEWGEGVVIKFQDEEGDWVKLRRDEELVNVWKETETKLVTLKVVSTSKVRRISEFLKWVIWSFFVSLFSYSFVLDPFLILIVVGKKEKIKEGFFLSKHTPSYFCSSISFPIGFFLQKKEIQGAFVHIRIPNPDGQARVRSGEFHFIVSERRREKK